MVRIRIKKKTLFLLNLFLALSVIVNIVMIFRFSESNQELEHITLKYAGLISTEGLSMSKNFLFSGSPVAYNTCRTSEGCSTDFSDCRINFYSDKIRVTPEIRSAAVQATSYVIPEYHELCDKIKDVDQDTSLRSTYCKEAASIYYWVRDNIRYVTGPVANCEISETCQDSIRTLELKAGKCDEQAVLLVSMLRSVGINAWVVLLDTDLSFDECLESDCSVSSADHSIVVIELEGLKQLVFDFNYWYLQNDPDTILLDPTCKTCEFGELPPIDQDRMVWVT